MNYRDMVVENRLLKKKIKKVEEKIHKTKKKERKNI